MEARVMAPSNLMQKPNNALTIEVQDEDLQTKVVYAVCINAC